MASVTRVVLDTNVLVAAAYNPRSASRRVVEACLGGELTPVLSRARRRAAAAAPPGSRGPRRGGGRVHAPRPGGTGRWRGCPRHRPRWPALAPDNVSGPPHDLAFTRWGADSPDRDVEISDERGVGRRAKLWGREAVKVQVPCLPLFSPGDETDIMPRS